MALADIEVVEIMRRCDLDRASALFRIGIGVGDDADLAADQRQDDVLADEVAIALVVGMHGDTGVAKHGLRPRRGDRDEGFGVCRIEFLAFDGIAEVPKTAIDLQLLDLDVGNRGLQLGIPADKTLILVDQPLLVEGDENLDHRPGQALVHGEALARPVAGSAEPLQLVEDHTAGFGLPLPDLIDELLTAEIAAMDLLFHKLALDHHLGGDAGMVHARLPKHVLAAHALEADHDVLQRVVERVAHVQRAGNVGRRDDDGKGLGAVCGTGAGAERVGILPQFGDLRLDGLGVVSLLKHRKMSATVGIPVGRCKSEGWRRVQLRTF